MIGIRKCAVLFLAALLFSSLCVAEDTTTPVAFVRIAGGYGPQTGWGGETTGALRLSSKLYDALHVNLAGGTNGIGNDLMYQLASSRGVTLWGRGGVGGTLTTTSADSSSSATSTSAAISFAGGGGLSYDLSRISSKLDGLEIVGDLQIKYGTVTDSTGASVTTTKPSYSVGVQYNFFATSVASFMRRHK